MSIFHVIVSMLTFPGAIFRQLFAQLILSVSKVKINSIRCFSTSSPCAKIEHDKINSATKNFFLAFIPFLITLALSLMVLIPTTLKLFYVHKIDFLAAVMFWLGFSLLCQMFPEYEDAKALWSSFYGQNSKVNIILKILFAPINVVLLAGSWLMHTGLILLTSIAFTVFVPWQIINIFYI